MKVQILAWLTKNIGYHLLGVLCVEVKVVFSQCSWLILAGCQAWLREWQKLFGVGKTAKVLKVCGILAVLLSSLVAKKQEDFEDCGGAYMRKLRSIILWT